MGEEVERQLQRWVLFSNYVDPRGSVVSAIVYFIAYCHVSFQESLLSVSLILLWEPQD